MKINGYEMGWTMFVRDDEGNIFETSDIKDWDATDDYSNLLIYAEKKDKNGKEMDWAGYWNHKDNCMEVYNDGTNVSPEESSAMKYLLDSLLEDVLPSCGYSWYSRDGEEDFLKELTRRLSSTEKFGEFETETVYAVSYEQDCSVYTEIVKERADAMAKVFDNSDGAEVSAVEVTGLVFTDWDAIKERGYDFPEEMAADVFGFPVDYILSADCNLKRPYKQAPAKSATYFYVDFYQAPESAGEWVTSSEHDRKLIKSARETIKCVITDFSLEDMGKEETACINALGTIIESPEDLKEFISYIPDICKGLEKIGEPAYSEDLKILKNNIETAFNL